MVIREISESRQNQSRKVKEVCKTKKAFSRIISVASGKGGVGKTIATVNIALALRRMGHSVLILDGDLGLANVDVVLGLKARYNINDVISEKARLKDILLDGPMGIRIIPSGSGISKLTQLSYLERLKIIQEIESLNESFEFLVIDTGAGISSTVLHLNAIADDIIVVSTPEPHSMTDAYAFIKVMAEDYERKSFNLVINMVRSKSEGEQVLKRISDVARNFLKLEIRELGSIPYDKQMQQSLMMRQAASEKSTYFIAGQAWNEIARLILENPVRVSRGDDDFWRRLVFSEATGSCGA
ncbi:MAG: MinD/ParA family protein [Oligoflexales bacterium]|nr:MinD/ParA family protein [Oligoflexales bacterium]